MDYEDESKKIVTDYIKLIQKDKEQEENKTIKINEEPNENNNIIENNNIVENNQILSNNIEIENKPPTYLIIIIITLLLIFLSSIIFLIMNFKFNLLTDSLPVFIVFIISCAMLLILFIKQYIFRIKH